jgi:hypothetical protein
MLIVALSLSNNVVKDISLTCLASEEFVFFGQIEEIRNYFISKVE